MEHCGTRFISFTGSKEVGLRINRLAAETQEGQIWIKRVVAEMGGKDGIVVDEQPTVFSDVHPAARIMKEEIFGPVLAICKAKDWQAAIHIYNDTEYGLTGAFFSQDEERIRVASAEMHCGNLYINRKCTGAFVGAQPFGGFNMSGTDSKAGGYDYLQLFTQAKIVTKPHK